MWAVMRHVHTCVGMWGCLCVCVRAPVCVCTEGRELRNASASFLRNRAETGQGRR